MSTTLSLLEQLKIETQETDYPCFTDEQLQYYLAKNGQDLRKTCYEVLILKSQNSTLALSGYTSADTSGYFKRLAQKFVDYQSFVPASR